MINAEAVFDEDLHVVQAAGFAFPVNRHMLRHAYGCALANAGHDTTAIVTLTPKRVVQ
jgi:site-specific recombinase XerD